MVEGGIDEHGLILLPASSPDVGFNEGALASLTDEASGARLQVYYRDLRALGIEGGPNALIARKRQARVLEADHPR